MSTPNTRKVEVQLAWKYGRWTCVVGTVEISSKFSKPEEAKEDMAKSIRLAYQTTFNCPIEVVWI